MSEQREFKCSACGHEWEVPYGTGSAGRDMTCPKCGSANIHRVDTGGRRRDPRRPGGRRP